MFKGVLILNKLCIELVNSLIYFTSPWQKLKTSFPLTDGSMIKNSRRRLQWHSATAHFFVFFHSVVGVIKRTSDLNSHSASLDPTFTFWVPLKYWALLCPKDDQPCWCKSKSLAYLLYRLRLQVIPEMGGRVRFWIGGKQRWENERNLPNWTEWRM